MTLHNTAPIRPGRSVPSWVAPALEILELEAEPLLRTDDLKRIIAASGVKTDPYRTIQALFERGWLLRSGVQGVWIFAPAALAGPYPPADPFTVLRAARLAHPGLDVAVGLNSALWMYDVTDRFPNVHTITVPRLSDLAPGLRRSLETQYRITTYRPNLDTVEIRSLSVLQPESVLMHLAESPTHVTAWQPVLDALEDLCELCRPDQVGAEAAGRSTAARVRLAYLVNPIRAELTANVKLDHRGTVRFGPANRPTLRFDSSLRVADTILPHPPGQPT